MSEETIIALKQLNIEKNREIELMNGRINLLMKQQRESSQFPVRQQKKLMQAFYKKKIHDDMKHDFMVAKQSMCDPSIELKSKNILRKYELDEGIHRARSELQKQKQAEANYIKIIKKDNLAKIDSHRKLNDQEKRGQKKLVQQQQHNSKLNYQRYWDDRTNNFLTKQAQEKMYLSQELGSHQNVLRSLEAQESILLQSISHSRTHQQTIQNQINDAKTLSTKDYELKYGKPKMDKNQQIMQIRADNR